jgi:hypothetical protein
MKQWEKYIIENRSCFLDQFHLMEEHVIEACKIAEKEGKIKSEKNGKNKKSKINK